MKMAELSGKAVISAMDCIDDYDAETAKKLRKNEKNIDVLADRVSDYLVRLSPYVTSVAGSDTLNYYFKCVSEFERIGDLAINLSENAENLE